MNETINEQYVITTRNTGTFYIHKDRAFNLKNMINSHNPMKMVEIDDVFFTTTDIIAIMPMWKFEEINKKKTGKWECKQGNWHDKFEKCVCNWGMPSLKQKENHLKLEEKSITSKEKSKLIAELVHKEYRLADLGKLNNLSIDELKEFVENYK